MMESQKYAIVDIETTGHSPANGDRMIQIAIVIMRDWEIESTFTSFIHPGRSIPLFIQDLTKITDEDVQDALPFEAHADHIFEMLQDCVFVAHNADFDLPFLQAEFRRAGLPKWQGKKVDTVELAKILFPMSLSYKLGDLAADLGISLLNAHRADDDAKATAYLLKRCWEELLSLSLVTLEQLHKRSFRLKSNLSHLFFDALKRKRQKALDDGKYFYVRNFALRSGEPGNVTSDEVLDYPQTTEEKNNLMQTVIPNFEERPQQFTMMDTVWLALQEKQEVVIEASTGIGKTLGYMLPAAIYARQTQKKLAISTYTTHLLDQLLEEEVPKLEKLIGSRVRVAVLKGMQNYIDLIRFEQFMASDDESYDETFTILQVLVWVSKTTTGDLNELNVSGGGQFFIDKIRKIPEQHRTQKKSFDFYDKAIKQSMKADLLVTNHAMLLADLVRHEPLFEQIDGWIIDEAHQFIQAASQRDEKRLGYAQWKYIFGKIGVFEDNHLFTSFYQVSLKKQRVPMYMLQQLESAFIKMMTLFDRAMNQLAQQVKQIKKNSNKNDLKQITFLNELELDKSLFNEVAKAIWQWIDLATGAANAFMNELEELSPEDRFYLTEWQYWIRELKVKVAEWDEIFLNNVQNCTTWVELDRRNIPGSLQIMQKPVSVTGIIQKIFNPLRGENGIIWTSGTLTVPNNEHFITHELGIPNTVPIVKLQAEASYYAGASAYVVTDMPDIQQVSQSEYIEAVAYAITRTVRTTEGRCFVLFTSQDMLRKTVDLIQESELLQEYMLFAQGVTTGSRMKLLKSFQKFSHSVLFGTNSFWEGVDIPGDGLSAVIVVRLPFSSPDEPIFKARAQSLTEQGYNSFKELSLPEAILRFKQGFGRLIRSSQDKGVFIVLDRRIETKSYGKEFIRALPPISLQKLPLSNMVLELENWYNDKVRE